MDRLTSPGGGDQPPGPLNGGISAGHSEHVVHPPVIATDDGGVTITQDELGNTYDRVGGPYSSYKP